MTTNRRSQKDSPAKKGPNEKVITVNASKSFYKHVIEKLEKHLNDFIVFEGDYVMLLIDVFQIPC